MYCQSCGARMNGAAFCGACGAAAQAQPQPIVAVTADVSAGTQAGNALSIAGIVCGGLAFLIVPVVLGPMGVVLGAVAKGRGERLAVPAMVVGGVGLVGGAILGLIVSRL